MYLQASWGTYAYSVVTLAKPHDLIGNTNKLDFTWYQECKQNQTEKIKACITTDLFNKLSKQIY